MKISVALILGMLTLNAFALTEAEFNSCSESIKDEIIGASIVIAELEDADVSEDILDILTFSIPGAILGAPNCEALIGLSAKYEKIAAELKP